MKKISILVLLLSMNILNSSIFIDVDDLIDKNNNKEGVLTIINNQNNINEVFKCNTTQLNESHIITYTDCLIDPITKKAYNNIIFNDSNNKLKKTYIQIKGYKQKSRYKRGLDEKLLVDINIVNEIAILNFEKKLIKNDCLLNSNKIRINKGNNTTIIIRKEKCNMRF